MSGPWLLGQSELVSLEVLVNRLVHEAAKKRQTVATEIAEQRISEEKRRIESAGREHVRFLKSIEVGDVAQQIKERAKADKEELTAYRDRATTESKVEIQHLIEIQLKDRTTLSGTSLDEILAEPALRSGLPTNIVIKSSARLPWRYTKFEDFEIKIECPGYRDRLVIDVSATNASEENSTLTQLVNWADSVKPTASVKAWRTVSDFPGWLIIPIVYVIMLAVITSPGANESEVQTILEAGISDSNRDQVLELLLREQYNLGEVVQGPFPTSLTIMFAGLFIASIMIAFPPQSVLGLGEGQRTLERVRSWAKFVLSIPGVIVISILIPLIMGLLLK